MRFIYTFLILLFFGAGCSSTAFQYAPPDKKLLPPKLELSSEENIETVDNYLLKAAETEKNKETTWWIQYKRASLWKNKKTQISCRLFSELSKDALFPLAHIARLRAFETCPKNSESLTGIKPFEYKTVPSWMTSLALDVALAKAEKQNDRKKLMLLSYEKSKEHLPKKLKIDFTQRALDLAVELKNNKFKRKMGLRLIKLSPSEKTRPRRSDWLNIAYDFRRKRKFKQADKYYLKVLNHNSFSFRAKLKAFRGLRKSYKNRRDKLGHLRITRQMASYTEKYFKKHPRSRYHKKKFHDIHIKLARTEWTLGKVRDAGKTLAKIEKELRNKFTMNEVFWIFGRMSEEKKDYKKALFWYQKALKEKTLSAEFKEKLIWYKAWSERKLKKYADATISLKQLLKISENEFARSRYQFWLAKTLADQGKPNDSQLQFQELINSDPLGFYGLVAHKETEQLIPANDHLLKRLPSNHKKMASKSSPLEKFMDVQMVEWMNSLDEFELAKRYLNEVSRKYRKNKNQSEKNWVKIFNYYAQAGEFLSLYEQLGQLTPERRKYILEENPALVFPRPFRALVKKASREFGISSELIYSIMRQESAFNPRARSFADAFGLLQMLPEVAQKQASHANVSYKKPDDLFKPEVNIPVGASFLKKLELQWNNQLILTVASYNANDKAIQGWLNTRYNGNSLEFIEDIPYEETRGYVKLVIRNLIFYSLINAGGEKIQFPNWVLQLNPPQAT